MATVSKWTPFDVALNLTATSGTVTRTSATAFTVKLNVSWETYYSGALTNYGMTASSGNNSVTLNSFGTKDNAGSSSFTGAYSISGNSAATKAIVVTFRNFNSDNGDSATKTITLNVSVPAWTSYKVTYNANGGTGAPGSQTKWKDQALTLSSIKPSRSGYSFLGWSTSSSATTATYSAGANYTADSAATLYAVWKANTYTIKYNANGGSGAPANQTKIHGVALTLSSTKPTRTNYTFKGWGTSATATAVTYAAGASYTSNAAITLYAIWTLSYVKPTITGVSIARCDSAGTVSDSGTYARVKFNWTTSLAVSSIKIEWQASNSTTKGSATVSASGTSGSVTQIIGVGSLSTDYAYSIYITVADRTDSSSATHSLPGTVLPVDFLKGGKGVAIGKPAEVADVFDVGWNTRFRKDAYVGDKEGYLDGKQGIYLDGEGLIHLQRSSAQGYHPYLGFLIDDADDVQGMIRLNSSTLMMEFRAATGYSFGNRVHIANNIGICGTDTAGVARSNFEPCNSNHNCVIGHGNYAAANGSTNIYGNDIIIGSAQAGNITYRPYYRAGDSISYGVIYTAGFVSNSKTYIQFNVPLSKPIIGSPTVAVASIDGIIVRQAENYTHGSAASTYVKPSSYTASVRPGGLTIIAVMSNTTNAVNNETCGIAWSGTITLS